MVTYSVCIYIYIYILNCFLYLSAIQSKRKSAKGPLIPALNSIAYDEDWGWFPKSIKMSSKEITRETPKRIGPANWKWLPHRGTSVFWPIEWGCLLKSSTSKNRGKKCFMMMVERIQWIEPKTRPWHCIIIRGGERRPRDPWQLLQLPLVAVFSQISQVPVGQGITTPMGSIWDGNSFQLLCLHWSCRFATSNLSNNIAL